jgi:hypothetical protein
VRRLLLSLAAVALAAASVLFCGAARDRRARFPAEEDLLYLPQPSVLKAASLGHHELTADLVLMRAIIYFGAQMKEKGDYRWLDNYLDTIVVLDPKWKTPYRWAGVATIYNGRTITNENVRASSHFLELGVQQFPDDWELPFMLGCNWLFEMKSDDPSERAEFRRRGAEYVRHAALVGGGPSWIPLLAATILKQEGQEEAAVRHLETVYYSTRDEKTREDVRNRLVSLHAKIDFAKAERDRKAFEDSWRAGLPYAPPGLFLAIGAKRSARMDLAELARDPVLESVGN